MTTSANADASIAAPSTTDERATDAMTETLMDEGISVEEASELGVLTGSYDALLDGPTSAREEDGCAVAELTLTNVGQEPDSYALSVTPPGATVTPAAVELDPGASVVLELRTCDRESQVVLDVTSEGRGDVVARYRSG